MSVGGICDGREDRQVSVGGRGCLRADPCHVWGRLGTLRRIHPPGHASKTYFKDTEIHMKEPLWKPTQERIEQSNMTKFLSYLQQQHGVTFEDYDALHTWSVEQRELFWSAIWDFCGVKAQTPYDTILENGDKIMESKWFVGARLNFAENLLRVRDDRTALLFRNELGTEISYTYNELYTEVEKLASAMRAMGLEKGDRVAGFLPNLPQTAIAMLAASSIGAIWSSTSPDFGFRGVMDRFGQIEPRILFTADGYFYKGKKNDSLGKIKEIVEAIPSIEKVIVIPYAEAEPDISAVPKATLLGDFAHDEPTPLAFEPLPFDHPLYIMYSSGTTGVPKCIVYGAGGTLLQHLKEHSLHVDLKPHDRFFYFTTCGWMMWNWLITGLASGATVMLFDGSPFYPEPQSLFQYVEEHDFHIFGTSAKYLAALENAGVKPKDLFKLKSLKAILSTGSPLSEASFEYVYRDIKPDVHLASISGGTDLISCFVLGNPTLPVYSEEIQCRGLGMAVESLDEEGKPLRGEKGELTCLRSFPSQPIYFWNDPNNDRYRGAYFEFYDNIWRHGDFVEITERGGVVIYGRSDATLNPGGVRIGTAEIYRAIEPLESIADGLVIGRETGDDVEVVLFVKLNDGFALDDTLKQTLRKTIRASASPRHVPAKIIAVPDIPYTLSGKKVELAVRRVVHGQSVPNKDALANPEALDFYKDLEELQG